MQALHRRPDNDLIKKSTLEQVDLAEGNLVLDYGVQTTLKLAWPVAMFGSVVCTWTM